MKRHLLGIIALGLILSGIVGLYWGFSANSQSAMAAGVGLRAGLVLGALWIAFPQLMQLARALPSWLLGLLAAGLLIVVIRPQMMSLVLIVVAVLAGLQFFGSMLKPQAKKRPRRRSDASQTKGP
jgi:hypothetical protein